MPLSSLPLPTPYDPAEDPPGSIDPLGTVALAEQLANVLMPGLTARMWRARYLTFTALAALVGQRASAMEGGSEEMRLEARLGLERFFVSAIMRKSKHDESWNRAAYRLPGSSLARSAIDSGHQPLGRQNFLKGQAINGPFGVVQRLARNLDIIDDDNRLSRSGEELLLAWSEEQGLGGILDDMNSNSAGNNWLNKLVGYVIRHVEDGKWPQPRWWGWKDLPEYLRPDQPGAREKKVLFRLLTSNKSIVRQRCIKLLRRRETQQVYKATTANGSRGDVDRTILVQQIGQSVRDEQDQVDRLIHYTIRLIDAYEQVCGCLESTFRGVIWALTHRNGQAKVNDLLSDVVLVPHLTSIHRDLVAASHRFQSLVSNLSSHPHVSRTIDVERLDQMLQDARSGSQSEQALVSAVIERHRRVQKQKRKGMWIECDDTYWTLMPGFGDNSDAPRSYTGPYLHPYRVQNIYSMLSDLGKTRRLEVPDGEEA